jgi:membrane-anchored protein YejM (alkaline phosphatase superfamily)
MPRARWVLLAILSFAVGERVAYGFSAAANYQPILFASERYPLYLPTTFRKLASRLGVSVASEAADGLHVKHSVLSYPLVPLRVEPPARPLNIVWLAVESLRYDLLDRTIMPQSLGFFRTCPAPRAALQWRQHHPDGHLLDVLRLVRQLLVSDAGRAPVPLLMDVLQQQNYQFSLHTSQSFTYPPFQETVFARK